MGMETEGAGRGRRRGRELKAEPGVEGRRGRGRQNREEMRVFIGATQGQRFGENRLAGMGAHHEVPPVLALQAEAVAVHLEQQAAD